MVLTSSHVGDILGAGIGEFIIQEHVLQRFRQEAFTGFDVAPVEVTRWRRKRRPGETTPPSPPVFWELLILGWGGEIPLESGLRMTKYCDGCGGARYKGKSPGAPLIDPEQWDGSDFFRIWPLPGYTFVSDRVAQLIRKEKYRGCELVPAEELNFDELGPGGPPPGLKVRGPECYPEAKLERCSSYRKLLQGG